MNQQYFSDQELRESIARGVEELVSVVSETLGPKGNNVLLQRKGQLPVITKDGVTVAKFCQLSNPSENAAAMLIKQAAIRTNIDAGDGTTTSTVLAGAILRESFKHIVAGHAPVELRRGIDLACQKVVEQIKKHSIEISSLEEIKNIACISANGDSEIGEILVQAINAVGKYGSISVKESRQPQTSLSLVEGYRIPAGYSSPRFINDEKNHLVKYDKPNVVVTDHSLTTVDEMMPILELASRSQRPLIIFCDNIEGQALAALITNAMRGTMKVACVKAPFFGSERYDILSDIALTCGATFLTRTTHPDLTKIQLTDFGESEKLEIGKHTTLIVDGAMDPDQIDERIDALRAEIAQTDDMPECERIQDRITRLSSGVAVVNVGGLTDADVVERKHRIDDALKAITAAREEGILPGGGSFLIHAAELAKENLDLEGTLALGANIVFVACQAPFRKMCSNAAVSPDVAFNTVRDYYDLSSSSFAYTGGYDFINDCAVPNMIEHGIIDPAKVTRIALENAVSAAGVLITANKAIIEVDNLD